MTSRMKSGPVVLCVLDGWGCRAAQADNAISLARTPVWDRLCARWPHATLTTDGTAVGLPAGQMGNSEVGHMTIGAGRVIQQDLPRIDAAVADGSLAERAPIRGLIGALRASGGTCHLLGLLSPGGVHSQQEHIAALARIVAEAGVPVAVHAILDGRDTPPMSAAAAVTQFERDLAAFPAARIATVSGRFYAMDRDLRWERVARAYATIVHAEGDGAASADDAIAASYARDVTDEFVEPVIIDGYDGMRDGDGLLMANFRADRVREILTALLDPVFDGFARGKPATFAAAAGLCSYSEALDSLLEVVFPPIYPAHVLGQVIADHGLAQLRIAETEKYAHVTYFLNGGVEALFEGEERVLIPSPKIATYDVQPEMSAPLVTERLVDEIRAARFDFITVNYANADMVGHTGSLPAAIAAVEAVDGCLGALVAAVEAAGGRLLITADHGNAEQMRALDGDEPHTAHTNNPVPILLVGETGRGLSDGGLADIAPTVLALMGLPVPDEMTGRSLLEEAPDREERRRAAAR